MWQADPKVWNLFTGEVTAANPIHWASPQGVQFAQDQLARVTGQTLQPRMTAPQSGAFSWDPQAYFGRGMNAGLIANLYKEMGPVQADRILQQDWQGEQESPLAVALGEIPSAVQSTRQGAVAAPKQIQWTSANQFLPSFLPGQLQIAQIRETLRKHGYQV